MQSRCKTAIGEYKLALASRPSFFDCLPPLPPVYFLSQVSFARFGGQTMKRTLLLTVGGSLLCAQAWAGIIVYKGTLSGLNEVPPNASTATGSITVTLDTVLQTLAVNEISS